MVSRGVKGSNDKGPGKPVRGFGSQLFTLVLLFLLAISVYQLFRGSEPVSPEVPISTLVSRINAGEVKEILIKGSELEITYTDDTKVISKKEIGSSLPEALLSLGVKPEAIEKMKIDVGDESQTSVWIFGALQIVFPVLLLILFIWLMSRQLKGSSMQAFSFGQSKARVIHPDDTKEKVTFKDVAGVKEAKEELQEIVDFLKNPKKFLDIGARIPKGVLLMGAPGTGKTLLARAVAGEAKVPFIYLSGSEFVEMFVGVGASRVRDLFKMALKIAPSIIFIDEIDAVGRHRGSGYGGGNDEREQTLNQILVEMDGFEPNDKVIVMSATNRPDVLDPALLRPGRFDRRVVLDPPDIKDREEILKIHAIKKPLFDDVNLHVIAQRTPGFSGADLANMMNEAAILAAREDRKQISQYDLIRSVEKVMMGPERKSYLLNDEVKKITAYHEVGHALVSSVLPNADPVHKVTIIPRGRAAGYTLKLPLDDRKMRNSNDFHDDLASMLGGFAAEKLIFGDITTGPSNDISVASSIVRSMVTRYGMSDKIGPVSYEGALDSVPGQMITAKPYSEAVAAEIDAEVTRIMGEALRRAEEVLVMHRRALDGISEKLLEIETLEQAEFETELILYGIKPKKSKDSLAIVGEKAKKKINSKSKKEIGL